MPSLWLHVIVSTGFDEKFLKRLPGLHQITIKIGLHRIKKSKYCGTDSILNKILKTFAFELAPVVCDIYNTSMRQGILFQNHPQRYEYIDSH